MRFFSMLVFLGYSVGCGVAPESSQLNSEVATSFTSEKFSRPLNYCSSNLASASFNPALKNFSNQNALSMMMASQTVMEPGDIMEQQFSDWGFKDVQVLENPWEGNRTVVADHGSYVLLAVRGSQNFADAASNATFLQSPLPQWLGIPGWLHTGFGKAFLATEGPILQALFKTQQQGAKPIYVTGHSRGAALATLYALHYDLRKDDNHGDIEAIYSFATPRIGNPEFAAFVDSRFHGRQFEVANPGDLVTHVPPSPEAAAEVSHIVHGYLPWVRYGVYKLVQGMNYSLNSAPTYLATSEGYQEFDNQIEEERSFWSTFEGTQHFLDPWKVVTSIFNSTTQHFPHRYLCTMSEAARATNPAAP